MNLIGDGAFNDNLMNDRFYNVHNSVSLAGYGYFPPMMYQALTTHTNVELNPLDGMRLPSDNRRKFTKSILNILIALILFIVIFF